VLAQADAGAQTGVMTAPSGPAAPVAPGRPLLIRGATILSMDPQVGTLDAGDILVRDGRIAAVGRRIEAADTQVVEGAGRIALPGFVNSHIHLAQAILRGLAGDATLDEYFKRIVARYTRHLQPEDLGASNYAGALEQLSAGTTTIFDWSREALTPAHADAIVDAAERSGIRAFFGYGVTGPGQGGVAIRADVERLRRGRLSSDDGRVRLALALRGPDSSPMEEAEDDFRFARDLGLLHQFHVGVLLYSQRQRRGVAQLAEKGLIGPGAILVHANDLDPDEYRITAEKGAAISVTPEVEMMMGHGQPATGRALQAGHRPALGVDVVTGVGGDMFSQMRTALSAQRLADNWRPLPLRSRSRRCRSTRGRFWKRQRSTGRGHSASMGRSARSRPASAPTSFFCGPTSLPTARCAIRSAPSCSRRRRHPWIWCSSRARRSRPAAA
jgi:cytosine/adenosine deaminase-related metal-dependent hydrolase